MQNRFALILICFVGIMAAQEQKPPIVGPPPAVPPAVSADKRSPISDELRGEILTAQRDHALADADMQKLTAMWKEANERLTKASQTIDAKLPEAVKACKAETLVFDDVKVNCQNPPTQNKAPSQ